MTTSRKDNKEKKRKEVPWVSDCLPKGFPLTCPKSRFVLA